MSEYDADGSHAWDPQPARFEPTSTWMPPSQQVYNLAAQRAMDDVVHAIVDEEQRRLEALVWEMIADPRRPGIAVIEHQPIMYRDGPDSYAMENYTEMRLDTNVPDSNIYRFLGQRAYDDWVERGCPHD